MANISDVIAEFIINNLEKDDRIELSRNSLADYFSCVPSQINYVLNTRFTYDKGFVVESKRGGGGYISIFRIKTDREYFKELFEDLNQGVNYNKAEQIIERLYNEDIINERETELIKAVLTDKALDVPMNIKDKIRGSVLKEFISKAITLEEDIDE
jgi:transcriptional regulator CtsR